MVALNGERRPMKLYENVINALFVSFRSKGRGVIRNAFAPRDGGHLLLSLPHLASTFRLPLSLSLSLFSFSLYACLLFSSPGNRPFSSLALFIFLYVFFSCSPTPLFPVPLSDSQVKRPGKNEENDEEEEEGRWGMVRWKDPATEGE